MKKVLLYSLLLIAGLLASQAMPLLGEARGGTEFAVRLATMACLAFIMIRVGYEFDVDRTRLRSYAVDYGVAATAAALPWLFCAGYFVWVLLPDGSSGSFEAWTEALLAGRFAAPTSAGILFSMLAAAGLAATWHFRKMRVLAIFDDLDTVLLMIPLKMLIVGVRWQLIVVVLVMVALLWIGWRKLHALRIPGTWRWVGLYALGITVACELVYLASKGISDVVPIHIEVLLPAFVLGCMIARPRTELDEAAPADGAGQDRPDRPAPANGSQPGRATATSASAHALSHAHHDELLERPDEQRAGTWVSAAFMVLVGLCMPPLAEMAGDGPAMDWGEIGVHVLAITVLANLGKMAPLFFYRREAHWRERLALCVGLWPRGEVGAGVLVVSLGYGIGGSMVTVAALSLALNLLLTGLFIVVVRQLLAGVPARDDGRAGNGVREAVAIIEPRVDPATTPAGALALAGVPGGVDGPHSVDAPSCADEPSSTDRADPELAGPGARLRRRLPRPRLPVRLRT